VGHVAYLEPQRNAHKILVRKPEGNNCFEGLEIYGTIIVMRLRKIDTGPACNGGIWQRTGTSSGLLWAFKFNKMQPLFGWLRIYWLFEQNSALLHQLITTSIQNSIKQVIIIDNLLHRNNLFQFV
jgi:hypothetical protein